MWDESTLNIRISETISLRISIHPNIFNIVSVTWSIKLYGLITTTDIIFKYTICKNIYNLLIWLLVKFSVHRQNYRSLSCFYSFFSDFLTGPRAVSGDQNLPICQCCSLLTPKAVQHSSSPVDFPYIPHMVGISGLAISAIWIFPSIHTGGQSSSHHLLRMENQFSVMLYKKHKMVLM